MNSMKKLITLTALCLFSVIFAQAQMNISPGLRSGLNISRITQTKFDRRADFYIGGFVAIKFSPYYVMQPELTYSRQGATGVSYFYDEGMGVNVPADDNISIQYVSLAFVQKFTINNQFNVHVAPAIDVETNSNIGTNSDLDIGVLAGIGYTLPFGLTIEARVKKGLIDVVESGDYRNPNDNYYVDNYNTNFVYQIGVSYIFDMTGTTD